MSIPSRVKLVDVGPRDGLQNEKQPCRPAVKIELVHRLQAAGLKEIEVTSFVSAQVGAADGRQRRGHGGHPAPERRALLGADAQHDKGFEAALKSQARRNRGLRRGQRGLQPANINCSIAESIERFAPVVAAARRRASSCAAP
jgi:hydroxymethylglutaryl-CoA lyase